MEMWAVMGWCRRHGSPLVVLGVGAVTCFFSPSDELAWAVLATSVVVALVLMVRVDAAVSAPAEFRAPAQRTPSDAGGTRTSVPPVDMSADHDLHQLRSGAELVRLSDHDLCKEWRTSYLRLQRLKRHPSRSRSAVVALTQQRALYLDELERRYPAGFASWIAAGAMTTSNPLPYLVEDQGPREGPRDEL